MCECYLWVGVTYFSSVEDDKCEDKSHRKRAFLSKVFISTFGGSFFCSRQTVSFILVFGIRIFSKTLSVIPTGKPSESSQTTGSLV